MADTTNYVWIITQYMHTVPRTERYVLLENRKQYGVQVLCRGFKKWIRMANERRFYFSEEDWLEELARRYRELHNQGLAIARNAQEQLDAIAKKDLNVELVYEVRPDEVVMPKKLKLK